MARPRSSVKPEWGGGQHLREASPEFRAVGVGGRVALGPYLLRSAARQGGSGWQTRTRRWPGGHGAPSGPTWLRTGGGPGPRCGATLQLPAAPGRRGGGGVYTTQNSAGREGGRGPQRQPPACGGAADPCLRRSTPSSCRGTSEDSGVLAESELGGHTGQGSCRALTMTSQPCPHRRHPAPCS